ncbi:exodeoxyribonuclease V subunit alpha [Kineococcus terrestris]|uniref:exodeoxyribonuclease V subunit alpha n=1 Tax=Kineococcus terrestris TaxID=2044856 RepID=UPI0034DB289A
MTTAPLLAAAAPGGTPAVPGAAPVEPDRAARLALRATGALRRLNDLGVLHAADVHVATRLGAVCGEDDERVLLAAALAVRALRQGSVVLRLADVAASVVAEDTDDTGQARAVEVDWPEPGAWAAAVRGSRMTAPGQPDGTAGGGEAAGTAPPLRWHEGGIWLDRYWRQEVAVADDLRRRAARVPDLDAGAARDVLARLWPGEAAHDQRLAAAVCLTSGVAVLGGGPGTGKTTTVARLAAALRALAPAGSPPRVALAAPTGKAAARLTEAVTTAARDDPDGVFTAEDAAFLGGLRASTLHRLLGMRPGSVRARYDAEHRLPHDVVVVDEASMVGLGVVARLLAALRPTARLVLVGDPDQLASVEVGAVLADLVAPARAVPRSAASTARLVRVVPHDVPHDPPPDPPRDAEVPAPGAAAPVPDAGAGGSVADGVVLLRTTHRFAEGGAIAALAAAVREGDAEAALRVLRSGESAVEFHEVPEDEPVAGPPLEAVRAEVLERVAAVVAAARAGDADGALVAMDAHRVLCAHRRGPRGVAHWTALAHRWAVEEVGVRPRPDGRYVGMPVLVTANDPATGVFNGDTGVVLERAGAGGGRAGDLVVAVARGSGPQLVPLSRLADLDVLHAMTVHRSQGSQFAAVTVVAAPATSPLATREMLYTALTRARARVRLIGSAEAVEAAVRRPLARASGLADRLR